ncbi:MAG: histidine phosphatase family protein [Candidatus Lokiarchaeota archaeon]
MKWYIIRHADKEQIESYNPDLRHQDPPISEKGHLQAQKLLSYFSDKLIDKIHLCFMFQFDLLQTTSYNF